MPSLSLLKTVPKPLAPSLLRRFADDLADGEAFAPPQVNDMAGARAALSEAQRRIAEQAEHIRALESMALTDDLTCLLNRRGFGLALQRELSLARRSGTKGGVLVMADLDGFKAINDLWGHAAGDAYLKAVAAALVRNVRASDLVGRLGGDEFVMLFTGMDEETGLKRLSRLEKAFHGEQAMIGNRSISLKASFGLTAYTGSDLPDALFAAADLKLYAHKAHRRSVLAS